MLAPAAVVAVGCVAEDERRRRLLVVGVAAAAVAVSAAAGGGAGRCGSGRTLRGTAAAPAVAGGDGGASASPGDAGLDGCGSADVSTVAWFPSHPLPVEGT